MIAPLVIANNVYLDIVAIVSKIDELIEAVNALTATPPGLERRVMPCFCGTENAYRCPAHINPVDGYTSGGR